MFELNDIDNLDVGFKLLEARKRFERLFLFLVNGNTYIFRPLTISECESIYSLTDYINEYILDEWVVTQTIISNNLSYLLTDEHAGVASSLASSLIKHSTLSGPEEVAKLLEKEREAKTSTAETLDSLVKIGAGHFLADTKNITYKQQIRYVAFAEEVLGKKLELSRPQTLPKGKPGRKLGAAAAAILSKESADKPNFEKDNTDLRNV